MAASDMADENNQVMEHSAEMIKTPGNGVQVLFLRFYDLQWTSGSAISPGQRKLHGPRAREQVDRTTRFFFLSTSCHSLLIGQDDVNLHLIQKARDKRAMNKGTKS